MEIVTPALGLTVHVEPHEYILYTMVLWHEDAIVAYVETSQGAQEIAESICDVLSELADKEGVGYGYGDWRPCTDCDHTPCHEALNERDGAVMSDAYYLAWQVSRAR